MKETWKDISGFPGYQVSDLGAVRSWRGRGFAAGKRLKVPLLMRFDWNALGYARVTLQCDGKPKRMAVHRLVLEAFRGADPGGCEAAHGDGNPSNNCLENLRWATPKENAADKFRHGTALLGCKAHNSILTEEDVRLIKSANDRSHVIAANFGVSSSTIRKIRNNKNWKHVA